ncbi:hypothetical protein GFB49_11640 [Epibacterium sp. SM1979]|uniref:Tail assembly chaperone n=1 Tax=Tritonibacter litoralis TaxID=2662264 RepID=A0A843YIX9_9RHOB|nr:hypothetical protein [Tritonibacter litoralis]MQQ09109.1 hypothetical protein [Tritonibacter litoralis]
MNDALTSLTQHYDRLRNQTFTVPGVTKSDGEPLVIYFDPPTNAQAAQVRARAGNAQDEARITLYTVLLLAKDKDGNRLFDDKAETVQALTENVPGRILTQIANAIMRFSSVPDLGN